MHQYLQKLSKRLTHVQVQRRYFYLNCNSSKQFDISYLTTTPLIFFKLQLRFTKKEINIYLFKSKKLIIILVNIIIMISLGF